MKPQPRYVRKDSRAYRGIDQHGSRGCQACGSHHGGTTLEGFAAIGIQSMCKVSTCLVCETPQCSSNGLGSGSCSICYIGMLTGWAGTGGTCQRVHCNRDAVGRYRRRKLCRQHLKPVEDKIAHALAERDQHWKLVP